MADVVDKATRSRMMAGIRGENTKPELEVRRFLHSRGVRYRLHVQELPGKPDIVLPKYRTVIFVHGCFWHRHRGCKNAVMPKTNRDFWEQKLRANVARDRRNLRALTMAGWRCLVIWECEARQPQRLSKLLSDLYSCG
ncbi:MAG: DNA mismatch endonuclease Vsr [Betaproteobacteria bacterium]|nr:DNA mismatch endonuclease Vsr [Betaproteobacteria bacterium]